MSSDARAMLDKYLSERVLMQAIIDAAQLQGYLVFHVYDSRRSQPGWPDIFCIRGPVIFAIECKTARGRTTLEQDQWLDALKLFANAIAGHPLAVMIVQTVRPANLDEILEMLTYYAHWGERRTA